MDTSSLSILYIIISLASFLLFAKGFHLSLWSMLLTLDWFLWLLTTYASTVWNPYTKTEINKIEAVQRRAARYVVSNQRNQSSVSNMLQRLKWRPLSFICFGSYIVHVLIPLQLIGDC
jgi:hypothetical protein